MRRMSFGLLLGLLLSIFIGSGIQAQNKPERTAAVADEKGWTYIDKKGETVISLKFESAGPFEEGRAQVKFKGNWIEIDKNGRVIGKDAKREGMRMELVDEGYIAVGGGCVAYLTGKLIFTPKGEFVEIRVENSGRYFYVANQPIKDFEVLLSANQVKKFFKKITRLLDHPKDPKDITSRNARVEIFLPFRAGVLETTWREMDWRYAIDPLLKEIEKFVKECHKNSKKGL